LRKNATIHSAVKWKIVCPAFRAGESFSPWGGAASVAPANSPAWKNNAPWSIIASNDRAISPDFEEPAARKIGTKSITVLSGHLVMLSRLAVVARFTEKAARIVGDEQAQISKMPRGRFGLSLEMSQSNPGNENGELRRGEKTRF
jgi:hypothetical protein